MDGLQPFLPGCFGHGCAQRAVSHQQVSGIGSPFAGLAVAGFTGSAKFQHIAQHGNAAAAGAGLAVLYLGFYLLILALGPGRLSVDRFLFRESYEND